MWAVCSPPVEHPVLVFVNRPREVLEDGRLQESFSHPAKRISDTYTMPAFPSLWKYPKKPYLSLKSASSDDAARLHLEMWSSTFRIWISISSWKNLTTCIVNSYRSSNSNTPQTNLVGSPVSLRSLTKISSSRTF